MSAGPDPRRAARAVARVALVILGVLLTSGVAVARDRSVLSPASPPARSILGLFAVVLGVTALIFLLVEGTLLYCIFRFRRRGSPDGVEPPQVHGSAPIEVAWTVAPLLIVFVLFLIVIRVSAEANPSRPPADALRIEVIGHRWWWEVHYVGTDVTTANELEVPVSTAAAPRSVQLELTSADVIHSFWVPNLAGKTDAIPGRENHLWFGVGRPGVYHGQCGEYCGAQHANMKLRVKAVPPAAFARWLAAQEAPVARRPARPDDLATRGQERFLSLACVDCHTIRGLGAAGRVGPDLTHLTSRATLLAGMVPNDAAHLRAFLADPQRAKPGCLMPDFSLSHADLDALVAFLRTLR